MDGYIARGTIKKYLKRVIFGADQKIDQWVDSMPAADVVPVVHGRWLVTDAYPHNVHCSKCYTRFAQTHGAVWEDGSLPRNYCPNCGAKIDDRAGILDVGDMEVQP